MRTVRPEIVAPAGDWDAMRAAVLNGADAVYFGLSDFNARLRAANFTVDELPEVITYLHSHNVRGYVTLNTLIFSEELGSAAELVAAIAEAGADAVIVQDLGLARLTHRMCPSLPIHASTQMTLTEPRGIEIARELGIRRVILARELSIAELQQIAQQSDVELEVFVHGALCVSFSGQCLASEALGGRSGNRGLCAQPCRLPYRMIVDGQPRDLGRRTFLLSPQDLAAYDLIGELVDIGIGSFKIEGRLKNAAYVALATQTYRAAVDAAIEGRPFTPSPHQEAELLLSFSRGFTHGYLDGIDHQRLVHGRFSKARGVRVGTVAAKTSRSVIIARERGGTLKPGDGVVFDDGRPDQPEQGGRVYSVGPARGRAERDLIEVTFGRGDINLAAVRVGSIVWRSDDPALRKGIEQSYARDRVVHLSPLSFRVRAALGEPLRISASDDRGHEVAVTWDQPLQRAEKQPLSLDLLGEHLGRLGSTPFALASVDADALDPVMVPKSALNDLRRQAVEQLVELRERDARHPIGEPRALEELRQACLSRQPREQPEEQLCVLVRDMEQLGAVLAWKPPGAAYRPAVAYCDFRDTRLYTDAVARGHDAGVAVGLATLRIIKPGDEDHLKQILDRGPDVILLRNLAGLSYFREHEPDAELVGDFSLNVANEITADLLGELGLSRLVPSYDLTWPQMAAMLGRIDPERFEVVIHQHVPMFHMQHCVFAAFVSQGRDRRDCGRPCDRRVELRDRVGAAHPVLTDARCRNTVFNAVAQSAAEFVLEMKGLGVRRFRIELLRETPAQAHALLDCYARLLAGAQDGRSAWQELRTITGNAITRGTLKPTGDSRRGRRDKA